jgi:arsenite-transporting ATPase
VRLVLYTGKGGVGKTTTAAATAACAAAAGRRTLVASADAAHSLGDVLGERLGPTPVAVAAGLDAVELDARHELRERWGRIHDFLVSLFAWNGVDAAVAEELAMLPGAEEITTLLAVERLAAGGDYDLVVVDCAPTGAALRLVTLPDVAHRMVRLALPLLAAVSGVATPIAQRLVSMPLPDSGVFRDLDALVHRHLAALRARLADPATSVRLVVTPERMVIDEARRAHTDLALFEVGCDAVVANRLLPEAAAEEDFFRDWCRLQRERVGEVADAFAPLPVLESPLAAEEVVGVAALRAHGERIFAGRAPDSVLCRSPRVRFRREGDRTVAWVPLPGARPEQVEVAVVANELTITTGSRRRSLPLPRRFASLALESARLEGAALRVAFAPRPAGDEG